jgi:glycosyltransferase involved in cell wall biosynthesis
VVHTVVSKPSGNPPWFADVHVVLSEARRQQLEKSGARDVRIIHPGIPAITLPTRAQKAEARRKLGIDPVQPVVLFAGDLTESGGADHLARAIPRVPDALFVFACRAKGQGHAERQERLASDLGSRALWLGEVADMGSLVATADLHCLPADSLAAKMDLPMVVLESLRSGVPAVVTDAPPMNEMGGSESGVICVPHGDARALAETLTTLLSDPAQRKTLGQAGQQCVTDRYTATAMVRAYDDLYDELDSRSTKE